MDYQQDIRRGEKGSLHESDYSKFKESLDGVLGACGLSVGNGFKLRTNDGREEIRARIGRDNS